MTSSLTDINLATRQVKNRAKRDYRRGKPFLSSAVGDMDNLTFETELRDTPVTVRYNYVAGEPMVRFYLDGTGSPGAPEHTEIQSVTTEDGLIIDNLTSKEISILGQEALIHAKQEQRRPRNPDDY